MAALNVSGWSGVIEDIHEDNKVGFTSLSSDGYDFGVYFNLEDFYIHGEQCDSNSWKGLSNYAPVNSPIHFDAERFSKPVYEYGDNIWYQAIPVWIGNKPDVSYSSESGDSSYDDEEDDYNAPDVSCQSGQVVAFINRQRTAILESTINNKKTLVALETCRFYYYDEADKKFYQPNKLTESLDIDDWVQYEAFRLDVPHPCGVTYRVGLAWKDIRPNYDINRPTHYLSLPNKIQY